MMLSRSWCRRIQNEVVEPDCEDIIRTMDADVLLLLREEYVEGNLRETLRS